VPNLCPNCARQGQKFQKISNQNQKLKKFLQSNQPVKNTQTFEADESAVLSEINLRGYEIIVRKVLKIRCSDWLQK
jgi:hypothetical protein